MNNLINAEFEEIKKQTEQLFALIDQEIQQH
jgi:hypothetical protein